MTTAEKLRAEGLEKGLEKGRVEGLATIVRKQLTLKFGPLSEVALARVASASADELEGFAERLLLADSLAAVFEPKSFA
jgi:hypothetical protein